MMGILRRCASTRSGKASRSIGNSGVCAILLNRFALILSSALTTNKEDGPLQIPVLIDEIDEEIESMLADGAYDKQGVYDNLENHKSGPIRGIIPPRKDAVPSDNADTSPTPRDKLRIRED